MGIQKTPQVTSFDATGNNLVKDQMAHNEDLEKRAHEIVKLHEKEVEDPRNKGQSPLAEKAAWEHFIETKGHEPTPEQFKRFKSLLLSRADRYFARLYFPLSD